MVTKLKDLQRAVYEIMVDNSMEPSVAENTVAYMSTADLESYLETNDRN